MSNNIFILSAAQFDTLSQAYLERYSIHRQLRNNGGWFHAWRFETAPVVTTPQTCKSLCGMGLLEYETVDYIKHRGYWCAVNRYRITERGKGVVESQNKKPPRAIQQWGSEEET